MIKRILILLLLTALVGCSSSKGAFSSYDKSAKASYYANKFNGKKTASGEKFSNSKLTAAHRKLPFGSKIKVTNIANGKSVVVTVNDRGPFSGGFDIDLSKKAYKQIADKKSKGHMYVSIEVAK
ncbi:septal ring lytic transglycosylase RlpA family protein [Flavobacterium sp. DG1-102-2]|uniref:septal ring lytic transglycosylase RlpA family protein n=1 Tax=Flavobacterium sp. DG1-102-2 TaxID=3081663 RepID=UPI00294A2EC6|nr:septal ring lytic transglycosylase RlpA family protein [Flavobacterium sp. DG1-102-2]MDV6169608.1 septal ring lytic transglycosylase RlpA family protein [Flavobacterium sp. DG1-102-2]